MATLKLVNLEPHHWDTAINLAQEYLVEYPNKKIGIRDCVICVIPYLDDKAFIIYRTKTSVVVRGQ